jgi:mannose-6-phosphate isomerase
MGKSDLVYPLICKPVLKEKIWGGRKLESLFDMALPKGKKIGEAWLVADLKEGTSSIVNGEFAGETLSHVTKKWGEKLIGTAWENIPTGGRFPLLIKYLDAQDDLSIQVHPDTDATQKYFPNDFSKDESWIILHTDKNGKILHGFKPGITLKDFDDMLTRDKIVDCLREIKVNAGDVFRVAPGTVHALCSGVSILEIQEPSDSTFRIFDYNRVGDDGKLRALHIEESRKVMRFGDNVPPKIQPKKTKTSWGKHELLVNVSAYRIERLTVNKPLSWKVNLVSVQVLILLEGALSLHASGEKLSLHKGDCVILPATLGDVEIVPQEKKALVILAGADNVPMVQ